MTVAVALAVIVRPTATTSRPSWRDLPAAVQRHLTALGMDASELPSTLDRLDQETATRLRRGEWEALVYYALQSRRFTQLPPIEPALSANAHHERGAVPATAEARLRALTGVLRRKGRAGRVTRSSRDERLAYFRGLVADDSRLPHTALRACSVTSTHV